MALKPNQKKAVEAGCASCQMWGDLLRKKRLLGYPDEAAEVRQQQSQATYDAARQIEEEEERQRREGK